MDKFLDWMRYYNVEITWFLIGWLCLSGIKELAHGHLLSASIDLGIAFLNFVLYKRHN